MLFEHIWSAGPVAQLLTLLSVMALGLVLERSWYHFFYPMLSQAEFYQCIKLLQNKSYAVMEKTIISQQHGAKFGLYQLVKDRSLSGELRQQKASQWLQNERNYLKNRLQFIGLIGTLAPLLGLLGTVFGIIDMFKAIAHNTDPVTPALLAGGMWAAMITTALGLVIAIPCLATSYGFEQLSQRRLQWIQDALNEVDLILDGSSLNTINDESETDLLNPLAVAAGAH